MLLVDRLGLVRAAYFAAKQTQPDALENAAAAALAALHGVTMGDMRCRSWQGGNPGDPARLAALVEGCGLRARPLRQARGWGYQRLSALGTIIVVDAAPPPPPRMAATGCASTLAMEMSDGAQRLVVNCGGPGLAPTALSQELVQALRIDRCPFDADPRRYQFDRDPARRQLGQGRDRRRDRAKRGQ